MATLTSAQEGSAILVVHSTGSEYRVVRIADFLRALEKSYNALFLLNRLLEEHNFPENIEFVDEHGEIFEQRTLRSMRPYYRLLTTSESLLRAAQIIRPSSRLRLHAVELHSPGTWKFIGDLIPIDVIRKWFRDAHERRKDREYREEAEADKLELDNEMKKAEIESRELENELKKVEVFDRKIELAKKLGATEDDLAPLLKNLFYKPLKQLGRYDDVVDSVEVRTDDDAPAI
jgi:hypothetical protein